MVVSADNVSLYIRKSPNRHLAKTVRVSVELCLCVEGRHSIILLYENYPIKSTERFRNELSAAPLSMPFCSSARSMS